jgi:hypothetical protein
MNLIARSCAGIALGWIAVAMATGPARAQEAPAAPARFERVLWCSDAAGAALAARSGYTAVQLGRGADPAPVRELGLGYYLDQPIGKGQLELRDDDWRPVAESYARTRDPAGLLRPGCLAGPGALAAAAAAAAAEATRVRGTGLRFIALADEASATRHDAPLDTCRCEHCLAAFRSFVTARCGDLGSVNQVLGTQFARLEDVVPPTTDQIRRRELGERLLPADLRAFALLREFTDQQFAAAVHAIAAAVRAAVPGVPVGLTGTSAPGAFGGGDAPRLLPQLTLVEPYDIGGAVDLARSFAARGAHRYATLLPPEPSALAGLPLADWVRAQTAAMACRGLAGVVVWNDGTVAAAGAATPFGIAVQQAFTRLGPALDACAGATVEADGVWLVESQASVRAWWMLDSAQDGMTWIRRLASYEAANSSSQAARSSWIALLRDLGLQPHFVGTADLPERLLRERPRCLVLPATLALGDRQAQAILAYVQNGGTVLADHGTGLYDDDLLRRERGALDGLFGIRARSLAWDDQLVRNGASTSRGRGLPLAELGLRGELAEPRDGGDAHVEATVGRGRAVYLNAPVLAYHRQRLDEQLVDPARELRRAVRAVLQRAGVEPPCEVRGEALPTCLERVRLRLRDGRTVLAIRLNALAAPGLLQRLGADGPRSIVVELPAARTLGHLGGERLGTGTRFELKLDPSAALFLEVLE